MILHAHESSKHTNRCIYCIMKLKVGLTRVTERHTAMATLWLQWLVTHLSTGVREQPGVHRWVDLKGKRRERERGRDGQTMYTLAHTHLLSTEADVGLGKLGGGEVETALGAGPAELLPGKQLRGEEGEPSLPVPGPLLDALQVEQTVALHTTPHLRRGGRGEGERGRYGHINISISA